MSQLHVASRTRGAARWGGLAVVSLLLGGIVLLFLLQGDREERGGPAAEIGGVEEVATGPEDLAPASDLPAPVPPARAERVETREEVPVAAAVEEAAAPVVAHLRLVQDEGQPVEVATVRLIEFDREAQEILEGGVSVEPGRLRYPEGRVALDLPRAGTFWVGVEAKGLFQDFSELPIHDLPGDGPVTVRLNRPATLAVRVVSAGVGLPGVAVDVSTGGGTEDQRSDEGGLVRFEGLVAGPCEVVAWPPFQEQRATFTLEPGTDHEVELELPPGGRRLWRVLDENGEPAYGAPVMYHPLDRGEPEGLEVNAEGFAAVEPLPPGTYQLLAVVGREGSSDPRHVLSGQATVVAGETTEVVLRPDLAAEVFVTGRVLALGQPVDDCRLYFLREDVPVLQGIRPATTAPDGTYEVSLGSAGAYLVYLEPDDARNPCAPRRLVVPEGETAMTFDLPLPQGGIRGKVRVPDGEETSLRGAWAERQDGAMGHRLPFARSMEDTRGHSFEIPFLPAGTYRVEIDGRHVGALDGVRVEADRWTEVEVPVAAPGEIGGVLRGPDGVPVAGGFVFAHDPGGGWSFRAAESDSLGRYALKVPPGRVGLSARARGLATAALPWVDAQAGPPLEKDGVNWHELELVAGHELLVRVLGPDGSPVRVDLRLLDAEGRDVTWLRAGGVAGADTVLSSTSLRAGPLAPGGYTVEARPLEGPTVTRRVTMGDADQELEVRLR